MPSPSCQHIKTDGIVCGSPALRGKIYCYFHQRLTARCGSRRPASSVSPIPLDPIRDRLDLQANLSKVLRSLAMGRIDDTRASTLLKGLQQSAQNLSATERLTRSC